MRYLLTVVIFPTARIFGVPVWDDPIYILPRSLASGKASPSAAMWHCLYDDMFSHLDRTPYF